jgi:GT2 family glycosyltransferase
MTHLEIVILNYNTHWYLEDLLQSIRRSNLGSYQIKTWVVDNASGDDSVAMVKKNFPQVELIINATNLGYAKANNKALRQVKSKYVLLLNSDTLVEKNTLKLMLDFMEENPQWQAATCRVELKNGQIDPSCHRGFPTPWAAFTYFFGLENFFPQSRTFGQYHQTWQRLDQVHQIDVISGAFFLIRKKALDQVGLFDGRFFMYAEDIDLCFRLQKKGYQIAYVPMARITHFKKSSGRKKNVSKKYTAADLEIRKKASFHFFNTMKLFYDKHYKDKYPWLVRWLVLGGIKLVSWFKK